MRHPARLLAGIVVAGALALPATAAATPTLHTCNAAGGPAQCGTISVPFNRADPSHGTTTIAFAYYPRTDTSTPSQGTVVALDGGPGFASAVKDSFEVGPLVDGLNDHRDVLLIDQRGTGDSNAIKCNALQNAPAIPYTDAQLRPMYAACASQLGVHALDYGSAAAADDIDAVRAAFGAPKLDVYGVSYGTLLAEVYAQRYPTRTASLVLDSSYPFEGASWGDDIAQAFTDSLTSTCALDAACHASGVNTVTLVGQLATALRSAPVSGTVALPDGGSQSVTVGAAELAELAMAAGDTDTHVYRELPAAATASLAGDQVPLLRLWANYLTQDAATGAARLYSMGQDAANSCSDNPEAFDVTAPLATRRSQYDAAVAALPANLFGIFSKTEWLSALGLNGLAGCTDWVTQTAFNPPLPNPPSYPSVPTLLIQGDVDTSTPIGGAHEIQPQFPGATFVTVTQASHDLLEYDPYCGATVVAGFIATHVAPAPSCLTSGRAVRRLVAAFPKTASGMTAATAGSGDHSNLRDRRVAAAALATLGEGLTYDDGKANPVLRGGTFDSKAKGAKTTLTFNAAKFVGDVKVGGTATVKDPEDGTTHVTADLTVNDTGGGSDGTLHVDYGDRFDVRSTPVTITGTLGGRAIVVTTTAP